jgi:hypothetical protein
MERIMTNTELPKEAPEFDWTQISGWGWLTMGSWVVFALIMFSYAVDGKWLGATAWGGFLIAQFGRVVGPEGVGIVERGTSSALGKVRYSMMLFGFLLAISAMTAHFWHR